MLLPEFSSKSVCHAGQKLYCSKTRKKKKKRNRRLLLSICTFPMQYERHHRGYPLKQSSLGIFGFLLMTFTGKATMREQL